VIRHDLVRAFMEFQWRGGSPDEFHLLTLVPKKERSTSLMEFRPISLTTSVYKIMTKVLVNRLAKVLVTVDHAQSAFVGRRQIPDVALIANEVVDVVKRREESGLTLMVLRKRMIG
jgi:hypothetical protein